MCSDDCTLRTKGNTKGNLTFLISIVILSYLIFIVVQTQQFSQAIIALAMYQAIKGYTDCK